MVFKFHALSDCDVFEENIFIPGNYLKAATSSSKNVILFIEVYASQICEKLLGKRYWKMT